MIVLLKKEIGSFLNSLMGYVVISFFLIGMGIFIWMLPGTEFNLLENGSADIDSLFILAPWFFLFLIPAITMRMFSEEMRSGTLETLLTHPVSEFRLVLSKFGAAVLLVLFSLAPTVLYVISIWNLSAPSGNIDLAGIAGSYLGLLFLCSGFAAIGIFTSTLTQHPLVSFITGVLLSFFFYNGFEVLSTVGFPAWLSNPIASLSISTHYSSMSRGVIDSRDVVYFLSLSLSFLLLSRFVLERRKW